MKRIYQLAIIGALGLGVSSCVDRLDVKPNQSIDADVALSTSQDVLVTLNGAYDGLSSTNAFGGAYQYISELVGDGGEVRFAGTFATLDEFWNKAMTTQNAQINSTWQSSYSTINRANNVLGTLGKLSEDRRGSAEGEAKFIRAISYFELVKLFAKDYSNGSASQNLGVPLILKPTKNITDADYVKRNTVEEVYKQVLTDLADAVRLLPATAASSNFSFATRNAAQAFLARVHLQMGNYPAALTAANTVIGSGVHSLAPTYAAAFADASNGSEVIFRIFVNEQDGSNAMNTFFAPATFQGRGDVRLLTRYVNLFGAEDVRGRFTVRASNNTFTSKFLDQFGDVPVVRLAEMHLIRAEANQRLNSAVGATPLADVNAIRQRAGAKPLTAVTLTDILTERRLELAFEGQLLSDQKRLKRNIGDTAASDKKFVLPIPQREIDTNKNLVQNEGY